MPQDKNTQLPADTEPTPPTEGGETTDTSGARQAQSAATETPPPSAA